MTDINEAAATATATADKSKPYPLTGTVVGGVRRAVTKGASPKPYAVFRFAYAAKGKDGQPAVRELTAKAFGKGLANIEPALAAGGEVTMVGCFEAGPQGGRTINFYALPRTQAGQAAG